MFSYEKIGQKIKENFIEWKIDRYNFIIAAKVRNEEEYNLLKQYYQLAYSSSCDYLPLVVINGEYEGQDWYFICKYCEGISGQGLEIEGYKLESLTTKKKNFEDSIKEFV